MSQEANIELVENLRPWIHLIVQQYMESGAGGGDCSCEAGNGIDVTDGVISLAANAIVDASLSTPLLRMWNPDTAAYHDIHVKVVNNRPTLYASCGITYVSGPAPQATSGVSACGCIGGKNISMSGSTISLRRDILISDTEALNMPVLSLPDVNTGIYYQMYLNGGQMFFACGGQIETTAPPVVGGGVPSDCTCEGGNNISVVDGIVSLDRNIVVENSLSIDDGGSLRLWDSEEYQYRSIYLRQRDGRPHLYMEC